MSWLLVLAIVAGLAFALVVVSLIVGGTRVSRRRVRRRVEQAATLEGGGSHLSGGS